MGPDSSKDTILHFEKHLLVVKLHHSTVNGAYYDSSQHTYQRPKKKDINEVCGA